MQRNAAEITASAPVAHRQLYDDLSRMPMWPPYRVCVCNMQHAAAAAGSAATAAASAVPATNNLKLISNERICCHIINELQQ